MAKPTSNHLLALLVLVQLVGPVLKWSGRAFAQSSWWVATSLLWGPWLLALVLAALGWLLYLVSRPKAAQP